MKITKTQKGFTLIELMITVAIVGILAAIALPAYQDYTIRAQVAESLTLADAAKTNISESFSQTGTLPTKNSDASYGGASGTYTASVNIGAAGIIVATVGAGANAKVAGKTITLTPTETAAGTLSWACTSTALQKYLPKSCVGV